jgi:hypothetical protein
MQQYNSGYFQDGFQAAPAQRGPVALSDPGTSYRMPLAQQTSANATPPTEPAQPTDPAQPTNPAQPADAAQQAGAAQQTQEPTWDPNTRADPDKMGAAINAEPKDWPSVDDLHNAGISAVRITVRGTGGSPNYTETNKGDWKTKIDAYHNAVPPIDVTVNVPKEAFNPPMPELPPLPPPDKDGNPTLDPNSLWQPNDKGGPYGAASYSLIPFTAEGTRTDGGPPLNDAQAAAAKEWYGKFETWKDKTYVEGIKQMQKDLGDGVQKYEIWNEPDEPKNWTAPQDTYKPAIPPAAFGELLRDSSNTLKNPAGHDAQTWQPPKIVSGGLDSGNVDYLKQARDATGGTLYADEIGVHPYTKAPDQDDWQNVEKGKGHDGPWTGDLQTIRDNYYNEFEKPIEYTEVGDARPGNQLYIEESAEAVSRTKNVSHGYFFWSDPHDGPFALNAKVTGEDGQVHLVSRPALDHLTRMTHQPASVPVKPEI